jgi:deoxyribodipyrimidine photo-lyase
MVSARQAVVSALAASDAASSPQEGKGAETWLNELIWREFYVHIHCHFPQVHRSSFRPVYDRIAWENDADAFAAWCEGRTGYPVVDAAMRQLVETGWMYNRARMIVASFLVKDLLIDWRWGERFFMQHLVDGDPVVARDVQRKPAAPRRRAGLADAEGMRLESTAKVRVLPRACCASPA